MTIIFNKGYVTGLLCAASCFVLSRLQRDPVTALIMMLAATALLFISGALEIGYQFNYRYPRMDIASFYLLLYTWLFVWLFTAVSGRLSVINLRVLNMALLGLGLLVYLFALPEVFGLQRNMLEGGRYQSHFVAHWIGAAVVLVLLIPVGGGIPDRQLEGRSGSLCVGGADHRRHFPERRGAAPDQFIVLFRAASAG